jgi:predicted ATPase
MEVKRQVSLPDKPAELAALVRGVPDTLRQMIERQFARLRPEEQRLLEAGSVAGTTFTAAELAAALTMEEEQVEAWCAGPVRHGLWLRGEGPQTWCDGTVTEGYGFVHALYQEVLYSRVTATRRRRLHRQLGERLEAGYGAQARDSAAVLAEHFAQGGEAQRAVQYLVHAAQSAMRRSAAREALVSLTRGLELLAALPATPERAHQELALHLARTAPLMAMRGYGAPEVEQAYAQAHALCVQLGDTATAQHAQVLFGLRGVYMARAELSRAIELAQQSLSLATRLQDQTLLSWAHYVLGATLFHLGDMETSSAHMDQALTFYAHQQDSVPTFLYGHDMYMACLVYAAWIAWWRGNPEQARQRSLAALARAQALEHPFSLAFAFVSAAMVHQFCGEVSASQEQAVAVIALTTEHGFALWLAVGTILHGCALAVQGQGEQGLAEMHQGLDGLRATGTRLMQPYLLALLAEAYGSTQQPEAGLQALAEAQAAAEAAGEHWYDDELYRLQGELLLAQEGKGPKARGERQRWIAAGESFCQALDLARRQHAKALELRATLSLSQL